MARIKMHISKAKLPFYPLGEVKYGLQNEVSTDLQALSSTPCTSQVHDLYTITLVYHYSLHIIPPYFEGDHQSVIMWLDGSNFVFVLEIQ